MNSVRWLGRRRLSVKTAAVLSVVAAAAAATAATGWFPVGSARTAAPAVQPAAPVPVTAAGDFAAASRSGACCRTVTAEVAGSSADVPVALAGGRFVRSRDALSVPGGVWLKVSGGTFDTVSGGHSRPRTAAVPQRPPAGTGRVTLEGPSRVWLTGRAVAERFLTGGSFGLQERSETVGDALVAVDGGAQVRGSIAGAGVVAYGSHALFRGDTTVRIGNVQRTEGCITGSFCWGQPLRAHAFQTGHARVEVIVPPQPAGAEAVFAKSLSGGPWVGFGLGEASLSGDASVTVDAPGVTFPGTICGGGQSDVKHPVFVRVGGNTSVTLKRGRFCGTVTAGGLPGYTVVEGRAELTLQGGSYAGAALLGGAAGETLLRIAADTDLRSAAAVDGFDTVALTAPHTLTLRAESVRSGTCFRLNGGTLRIAVPGADAPARPYVFPARTEGAGQVVAVFDDGRTAPLVNGRIYLPGRNSPSALLTVSDGGSWQQGWSGTPAGAPPVSGDIILDASALKRDTALTVPAGRFATVRILGNGRSALTLRLAPGAAVARVFLYADARLRFAADGDSVLPFAVAGNGIFEKSGRGRTELSQRLTVAAPGYVRVAEGTLAFTRTHTLDGNVRVSGGAVLDFNGTPDGYTGTVLLEEGAVLANDAPADIGVGHRQMTEVVLLGNATVRAKGSFGLVAPDWGDTRLILNGCTLSKTGPGAFRLVKASVETGGGTLDVREGTVEFSGGGTETAVSGDLTVRTAAGADFRNPTGWLIYRGAVTFAPEDVLEVRGRPDGSGPLRIASGTVRLLHPAPLRRGRVVVDSGATLDLTAPGARALHEDKPDWGFGYIRGSAGYVTVRGTLRTRPWHYNAALGGLAVEADRVLLDGGTVFFAGEESFDETADTRGFSVSERGAVLGLPAGRSYTKLRDPKAGIDNRGVLKLRRCGSGEPARFVLHPDIAGTLEVGEGCSLAGSGTAENVRLCRDACLVSEPGQPVKTVTRSLTLPDRFDVRGTAVFGSLGSAPALMHLAPGAVTAGNLDCRIRFFAGDCPEPEEEAYRPAMRKHPDGGFDVIAVPLHVTLGGR